MYFKEKTLRELLMEAKNGIGDARETLILMYYQRIKKILMDLKIPNILHEDILHDCILSTIEIINELNADDYDYIYGKMRAIVIKQVAKSLEFFYDYNKDIDGKVFDKPSSYLSYVTKHKYNFYNIINEYIRYGTIKESIINDEISSDRVVEDTAIDDAIKEEYWKYVSNEEPVKQLIITGRFPIDECYEENKTNIAKKLGCSRNNIDQEEKVIRARMSRYSKFYQYLRK